jgi:hypothetical protein
MGTGWTPGLAVPTRGLLTEVFQEPALRPRTSLPRLSPHIARSIIDPLHNELLLYRVPPKECHSSMLKYGRPTERSRHSNTHGIVSLSFLAGIRLRKVGRATLLL